MIIRTYPPVAHRGLHGSGKAENSMEAFSEAFAQGFGVETDIRVCRDALVLSHDPVYTRADGTKLAIKKHTRAELGGIPTVGALLRLCRGRAPLMLEVKCALGLRLFSRLKPLLRKYRGDYCIVSFSPLALLMSRIFLPNAPRGQLLLSQEHLKRKMPRFAARAVGHILPLRLIRPDFLSLELAETPTAGAARALKKGMDASVWTIRSTEDMVKAEAMLAPFGKLPVLIFEKNGSGQ